MSCNCGVTSSGNLRRACFAEIWASPKGPEDGVVIALFTASGTALRPAPCLSLPPSSLTPYPLPVPSTPPPTHPFHPLATVPTFYPPHLLPTPSTLYSPLLPPHPLPPPHPLHPPPRVLEAADVTASSSISLKVKRNKSPTAETFRKERDGQRGETKARPARGPNSGKKSRG